MDRQLNPTKQGLDSADSSNRSAEEEEQRLRDLLQKKKNRKSNPEVLSFATNGNSRTTNLSSVPDAATPSLASQLSRPLEARSEGISDHPAAEGSTHRSERKGRNRSDRRGMNREGDRRYEDRRGDFPPFRSDRRSYYRPHLGGHGPTPPAWGGPDGPGRWERHPPPRDWRAPPSDRIGSPPPRAEYDYSSYRSRSRSRSYSRSRRSHRRGRSRSRSRSASRSVTSSGSDSRRDSRSTSRSYSRSRSRSHRSSDRSSSGSDRGSRRMRGRKRDQRGKSRGQGEWRQNRPSIDNGNSESLSDSSSSSNEESSERNGKGDSESAFSKDQRTVFVSQLVMRTTERDIRRYFRKKVGCQVKDVILLRDKRTRNHKGCAYVQLGRIEDVVKAVGVSGQPPDFQRFPILVKSSEAEKNYIAQMGTNTTSAGTSPSAPLLSQDGRLIESQKVYVGGLDQSVSEEHLFALFSQFGHLENVSLQVDPVSRASRGYAFLSFRDPKEANLAIQAMANQVLAGRPMKTGWASQPSSTPGVQVVTSDGLPDDANTRSRKAFAVLGQMSGASIEISVAAERALDAAMTGVQEGKVGATAVSTVAEVRATPGTQTSTVEVPQIFSRPQPSMAANAIGINNEPTNSILVYNMFDKDQEEGESWATEIKEEFEEECSKFGKLNFVKVMSSEPGGKIYASFDSVTAAAQCAKNLAGRWFDKRQLRVEYLEQSEIPL